MYYFGSHCAYKRAFGHSQCSIHRDVVLKGSTPTCGRHLDSHELPGQATKGYRLLWPFSPRGANAIYLEGTGDGSIEPEVDTQKETGPGAVAGAGRLGNPYGSS